jgi:hypothetical protein
MWRVTVVTATSLPRVWPSPATVLSFTSATTTALPVLLPLPRPSSANCRLARAPHTLLSLPRPCLSADVASASLVCTAVRMRMGARGKWFIRTPERHSCEPSSRASTEVWLEIGVVGDRKKGRWNSLKNKYERKIEKMNYLCF